MLTSVFGDNFAFADSTEMSYGLPVRSFTSFNQAAAEAAISRLYGGIHYRMAIEAGCHAGTRCGPARGAADQDARVDHGGGESGRRGIGARGNARPLGLSVEISPDSFSAARAWS